MCRGSRKLKITSIFVPNPHTMRACSIICIRCVGKCVLIYRSIPVFSNISDADDVNLVIVITALKALKAQLFVSCVSFSVLVGTSFQMLS